MAGEYEVINKYHITNLGFPETIVTVSASGGDYTSIKAAIAGVSPTVIAPVRIVVKNGTYNEIQINGKDYLTIEGESRDGVVMISDGLREDIDPISGVAYSEMLIHTKHGFWISNTMTIKNMTIRVNDVKYCVHMDNSAGIYRTFTNCKFQHSNGFPIGIGAFSGQKHLFTNCVFEKLGDNIANGTEGSHGIFWHNWNEQALATEITLNNCSFINCGLIHLFELGSTKSDLCKVVNCTTDDTKGFNFVVTNTYYQGGAVAVADIPYCINLLTIGGTFQTPIDFVALERPNLLDHVSIE